MNLYRKLSISIFITSLLLCGNAFATKPSPVEVVNTPDVNVVNTILLENTVGYGLVSIGGVGGGGGTGVSPGYLHGFNLSLAAEPGDKCVVGATIEIEDKISAVVLKRITLSSLVAFGGSTSIAHDFTTPIEVLFDTTTEQADVLLRYHSFTGATAQCTSAITLIYELF